MDTTGLLKQFKHRLAGLNLPADFYIIGTALIVGILTGLGAVAFRYLISGVSWVGYTWFPSITPNWGKAYVVIIPAIGGLIVGPLIYFFAREAKGHGVPEVMEAVALRGGRIRPVVAIVKSLASSISIGSGGSVGREGPIVQIGSAIGSTLGQVMHLSEERVRNMVACGAAAGIAATFNAPIAGVIFALEVILGEFTIRHFSSVVVASVTASVIGRTILGDTPAFKIPFEYGVNNLWEFALYPILGLVAALAGTFFTRLLYWSEDRFAAWKSVPEWVQPAIGGLLLGLLGLSYPLLTGVTWEHMPQVYNVGYDVIEAALASSLTLKVVLVLLVMKLIATSLTIGSGGSGGVFAPSLFMGAMLGSGFDLIVQQFFPHLSAPPGAYALLGMAAMFAAIAHAPMTAVLILFELTGNYRIILPLMLTVVIATLFAQWFLKGESIYTLKLTRRGVRLSRGRDIDIMQGILVREVMSSEIESISAEATLAEAANLFSVSGRHGLAVTDVDGLFWGVLTISDLRKGLQSSQNIEQVKVHEVASSGKKAVVAYPDESIGVVLNRMASAGVGRLPVIDREDRRKLEGWLSRRNIIQAYELSLTRRAEVQHQTKQMQLRNIHGTEFEVVELEEGDPAVGKTIAQIAARMPRDCVVVSIQRGNEMIIPHGDTVLQAGDKITTFLHEAEEEALQDSFHKDGEA